MRVTVLGSGSGGNSTLIEARGVRILVDAGFSGRSIERRLAEVGVEPESISGVVVTHDHTDHTQGAGVLARRFGWPLYMTPVTRDACAKLLRGKEDVRPYASTTAFRIGTLEIQPFLTVHDAADPVAVTLLDTQTGHKLGIATDLGRPTAAVRHALAGCHLLVLEANHDEVRLWDAPYPWSVKQRIASSHGHLSNEAAAVFAGDLWHEGLAGVVLAHLSEHSNDPELARDVVGEGLEGAGYAGPIHVARQDAPLEPIDVGALRRRTGPEQLSLL